MKWTLPLRYSIPLILAAAGLALTGIAFYDGLRRSEALLDDLTFSHAVALGTRLVSAIELRSPRGEARLALDAVTRAVTEPHLNRAVLFDSDWQAVVSTDYRLRGHALSAVPAKAGLADIGARAVATMTAQHAWTENRDTLYSIFPVVFDPSPAGLRSTNTGALLLEFDLAEIKRINMGKHVRRAAIMGVVTLFSLALVWLLVYATVTRRLARFAHAIEASAAGKAGADLRAAGMDELGRFSVSIQRIVSDLRASSAALAESESRYRSVIHAMSEGVVIQRLDGAIVGSNASASLILGLSEDELHGRKSTDPRWRAIHEDGSPFPGDAHPAMVTIRTGRPQLNVIMGVHRPDGTLRWISINSEPVVLDAARMERGVVTTFTDITGRREAELQSRRDRERFAAIVESAMDGVICVDGNFRITLFNGAAEKIFGHREADLLGQPLDVLIPERFRARHESFMRKFSIDGTTQRSMGVPGEITGLRANGEGFPIEASISRVNVDGDVVLTAILRDVSERKRAEAQREHLEAQLRQSQRLQSLGTLTGGIAHDFNNILTAISGNAKLARQELDDANIPFSNAVRRSLVEIDKAARRATDLVRQVLAFGRRQEANRTALNLAHVVGEALRFLRATLPAMIEIRSRLPEDLPLVCADASQIHQVIANLGSNAAHAIGERPGIITVELDDVVVDKKSPLTAEDIEPGRYVRLSVSDTGGGIDPTVMDRIYEPFFTTKPVGVGTGLGLSVVHGIVKSHDGAIVVNSVQGEGTRFDVYLPAATVECPTIEPAPGAGHSSIGAALPESATRKTIVYLDDEEPLVYLVTRLLEREGYRVLGFNTPDEALAALGDPANKVDVLVTDLAMPGMSGFDVTRAAHKLRPNLHVVMVSGYVRPQDVELSQTLGVSRLILKPDTVEGLALALREILEKDSPT